MRAELCAALAGSFDLLDTRTRLVAHLETVHSRGVERVVYVAGIITSDGPKEVGRNIRRIEGFTRSVQSQFEFPIFSPVDVFGATGLWEKFVPRYQTQDWIDFWRGVLESGQVTDLVFTPRWEKSVGAKDEYETARRIGGVDLHYIDWRLRIKKL